MALATVLMWLIRTALVGLACYVTFLTLLAIPYFQNHIIYLHKVKLTWFQDINVPEQWGFMHKQVTPFTLNTPDGEVLRAWHILPLELYRRNEETLTAEPSGLVSDVTQRHSFKLLRDDPNALLVLYLHGAGGTVGSGYRPSSYRAIYAGAPDRIHIAAIDYRGFGDSTGDPSEAGLLTDALTLVEWAINTAGISPHRIVLFAQSLGTAVAISLAQHLASQSPPTLFAGMALVAPFVDVETLTKTYRVAKTIPLLSPLAYCPRLITFFNGFIVSKWRSRDKLAEFVRTCEDIEIDTGRYHVTLIHAEDDFDIPWEHSDVLYWHAVNASRSPSINFRDLQEEKRMSKRSMGAGGWKVEHRTKRGVVREQILKYGLHDKVMGYPVVSLAIQRAFEDGNIAS